MTVSFRPPSFNHVFIVVDALTLAAINACDYLAGETFGRFATVETESTLIGPYRPTRIFGENTMIELFPDRFGAGPEFGATTAGVVLSFDHGGEREAARRRLSDAGLDYQAELVRRQTASGELAPTYHSTRPDMGPASPLALFASEIAAEQLARLGLQIGPSQDRAGQLTASVGRPHAPEFALSDVVGVTVRLGPERAARLARVLEVLGYAESDGSGERRLRGPDADVVIVEGTAGEGVTEVRTRLRTPDTQPGRRFDFGSTSTLVLSPGGPSDASATWTFTPLEVKPAA
jgi:hypothetical protein